MLKKVQTQPGANEEFMQAEIARLNKIIQALMNRAERNTSLQGSDFNLFQTAITLEDQVHSRTEELETALEENEKISRTLRESESHYRLLVENSPMSIHEIGMDGRIISMNRSGVLMMGLDSESEVQGALFLDSVGKEDRERIGGLLARAYAGETSHFEFQSIDPNGQIYKSCFVPIKNKNGSIEKLMGIMEDITEQKRAREKIELSNTILRTEQDVSPDAILVVNENGKIISYNQQFIDLWKLPAYMVSAKLDAPVLQAVADQVENPELFVERVINLYQHRDEKSREEIRLKDGKIIDRYSAPISAVDGKYYGRVWYFHDITERKKAEELIRNLAFNDALTQLPNRRLLQDRMKQAMVASKRSGRYGAAMFLDLDNFKPLNDTHGHDMGDLLLIEVARRITRCVREIDTVARFGGDEFVVMLSELDTDQEFSIGQAAIVAEKIRVALAEPYLLTRRQADNSERIVKHYCTSSIGVVLFNNIETSPDEVLKRADKAMYQAKIGGRNRVQFFEGKI
jgi:diguanylate cyclase (GGDEF)-like protein/PAS domain S-box-containing protein